MLSSGVAIGYCDAVDTDGAAEMAASFYSGRLDGW